MEAIIAPEREQWDALVKRCDHPHANQSWEWGEAYGSLPNVRVLRLLATTDGVPAGALQAFEWRVGAISLALTSGESGGGGGPMVAEDLPKKEREEMKRTLLKALVEECQERKSLRLTVFTSPGDEGTDVPGTVSARVWHPVVSLDRDPESMLRERIDQKTRNQILRAEKNGVTVSLGTREDLPVYLAMQRELVNGKGLPRRHLNTLDNLTCLWDALEPHNMLKLYLARKEDRVIGGALILSYQRSLLYRSGVATEEGRMLYAGNALQWRIIRDGIEEGSTFYNLGGGTRDTDDPRYGITKYKLGFGGEFMPATRYTASGNKMLRFFAYRSMRLLGRNEWFPLLVYP